MKIAAVIIILVGSFGMGLAKKYQWNSFNHFIWKSTLATIITMIGVVLAFVSFGWYGFIPVIIGMLVTRFVGQK